MRFCRIKVGSGLPQRPVILKCTVHAGEQLVMLPANCSTLSLQLLGPLGVASFLKVQLTPAITTDMET